MQRIFRNIIIPVAMTIALGCNNTPMNIKNGTFKVLLNDSITSYIERNYSYQLEYTPNGNNQELFEIEWISSKRYLLKVLEKKDSIDSLPLIVDIDSIFKNAYYQTSYMMGYNLKYKSKIVKINNTVSRRFLKALMSGNGTDGNDGNGTD